MNDTVKLPVILSKFLPFAGPREKEPNNDFSPANGPLVLNATLDERIQVDLSSVLYYVRIKPAGTCVLAGRCHYISRYLERREWVVSDRERCYHLAVLHHILFQVGA